MPTPHEILGIGSDATEAAIKAAYRKLVLQYHPDKNPEDPEVAAEKFKEVQKAYERLTDPEAAEEYRKEQKREAKAEAKAARARRHSAPVTPSDPKREDPGRQHQQQKEQPYDHRRNRNADAPQNHKHADKPQERAYRAAADEERLDARRAREQANDDLHRATKEAAERVRRAAAARARDNAQHRDAQGRRAGDERDQPRRSRTPPPRRRNGQAGRRGSDRSPSPERARSPSARRPKPNPSHRARTPSPAAHQHQRPESAHPPPLSPRAKRRSPSPHPHRDANSALSHLTRAQTHSTTLTTSLTALQDLLLTTLHYTPTLPRLGLVTGTLSDLSTLSARVTQLEQRVMRLQQQQAFLAREDTRALEAAGREAQAVEVTIGVAAERVKRVVDDVLSREQGRAWDVKRDWAVEVRSRVWSGVEELREQVQELLVLKLNVKSKPELKLGIVGGGAAAAAEAERMREQVERERRCLERDLREREREVARQRRDVQRLRCDAERGRREWERERESERQRRDHHHPHVRVVREYHEYR